MSKIKVQNSEVSLSTQGYVILREYLSSSELTQLDKCANYYIEGSESQTNQSREGSFGPQFYFESPEDGGGLRLVENMVSTNEKLRKFSDVIAKSISKLTGQPMVLFKDKLNLKQPRGSGYVAHRDGEFWWTNIKGDRKQGWYAYASEFINVSIFLDLTTTQNGCIEVERLSRHVPNSFDPPTCHQLNNLIYLPIRANPGDALIFHASLAHRSAKNQSNQQRKILNLTFNPACQGDHREQYYIDKNRNLSGLTEKSLLQINQKQNRGD